MHSPDSPPLADFGRYRFLREEGGALAELPGSPPPERVFFALDCYRYRLCRLHVIEGAAAGREEDAARFLEEMKIIQGMGDPVLAPLLDHGRDDSELFQVVAEEDGEELGGYLRRAGPLSEAAAARFILSLLDLAAAPGRRLATLENFDLARLQVVSARGGGLRLRFTDLSGWQRPLDPEPEALARRLALALCRLMAGDCSLSPPSELFSRETGQVFSPVRDLVQAGLAGAAAAFAAGLRDFVGAHPDAAADLPPARGCFRRWLGGAVSIPGAGTAAGDDDPFSAAGEPSPRGRGRVQRFPGWDSIPRESWLPQHRAALRRAAFPLPGLLRVTGLESRGRTLLVHEEAVEGLNAEQIVESLGPFPLEHALSLAGKVGAALEAIERHVGSAPIWWLEPRNVHVVTGGCSAAALATAMSLHGPATWQRYPARLRLHQTARDLAEGPNLPPALLARVHAGGKHDAPARRAAALLPLLWMLLTGRRLDWSRPLDCPAELPAAAAALLEKARAQLVREPAQFHWPLLRRLEQSLRPSSLVPAVPRLGFAAGEAPGLGRREFPSGAERPLAALGRRWAVPRNYDEGEIVSLGVVEDPGFQDAPAEIKKSATPARLYLGKLVAGLFQRGSRASQAGVQAAPAGQTVISPERGSLASAGVSAAGRLHDGAPGRADSLLARQEEQEDASVWTPPETHAAPAPGLRLVERSVEVAASGGDEDSAADQLPNRDAETEQETASVGLRALPPAREEQGKREDEAGELSFFEFLASASVCPAESAEGADFPRQASGGRSAEDAGREPGSEEDKAAAKAPGSPALAAIRSLTRAAGRFAGVAVILWALTYWLVSLAGSAEGKAGGTTLEPGQRFALPAWRMGGEGWLRGK